MQTTNVPKMIISVFDRDENIVGKGEIARYEQFLLFPQCFHKASFPEASKGVIVWEWVKCKVTVTYITHLLRFVEKGEKC